jgi:hypothetical protein
MESSIFLLIFYLILPTYQNTAPNFLHVYQDKSDELLKKPILINGPGYANFDSSSIGNRRQKRDLPTNFAGTSEKIAPKVRKRKLWSFLDTSI